ncbi:MAG: UDP-3-O-(3-hydroxymyristoyl)glucosamine N-acyltransferase [Bacteroidia bacterium]
MKTFFKKDIINFLNDSILSDDKVEFYFDNFKPIFDADEKTLAWLNPNRKDKKDLLKNTKAKIVIIEQEDIDTSLNKIYIITKNPKLLFLRIVNNLTKRQVEPGIHSTAIISKGAVISPTAYIGPYCVIENVEIGDNTIINSHCLIKDGTKIGKDVIIQSNVIIGTDGFGYSRNAENKLERFPHIGGVIIEDDVEIGSSTCIDKGSLGNTIIKKGCKFDNLVHIAHNVEIGENTIVTANAIIAGSSKIGNNCWIAPSVIIRDALNIGNNVTIGIGAVVTKDIPDNQTWTGNPAKSLEELKIFNSKIKNLIS